MTSLRLLQAATFAAATFSLLAPALAQSTTPPTTDKPAPPAQVASASQAGELKPEQLLLVEPTGAGPKLPTRAGVIEELKRARSSGAMDFASREINGPAN